MSDDECGRVRGRHAEGVRNDQLLLEAARDVFASQGASAGVAAVAERAGLGIGSLYRRYGSKTELLRRLCMLSMEQAIAAATAALAEADATTALTTYIRTCVEQRTGALALLSENIDATPEMFATARTARRLHDRVVRRAHDAGGLRADVTAIDLNWLVEQFARTAPVADAEPADRTIHARLLEIAIAGLFCAGGPLPGPVPTARRYEQRWRPSSPTT